MVGRASYPVCATTIPRSAAVPTSMAALRRPVEAISFTRGNRSMTDRSSGVRSRMTQTTSNGRRRSTTSSGLNRSSLNTVITARPSSGDQSAISSATFW
jgi:hypothetical protein